MDKDLNLPDTSIRQHDGAEHARDDPDNIDCDNKFKSSGNEKSELSDSDNTQSGSSDIDESNGFQKVGMSIDSTDILDVELDESNGFQKVGINIDSTDILDAELDESNGFQKVRMSIDSTDILDAELDESNGFQKVKINDGNASTPEHEIEDNDDDEDGFQQVKIKDGIVDTAQPESDKASEVFVPGTSFQDQTSVEYIDIKNEKIMTIESCYSGEATDDSLDEKCQEEKTISSQHLGRPSLHEGSVLRHRIAPEPNRNIPDEDDDHIAEKHQEELIPKGSKEKLKIALIRAALESDPIDIASLRKLAISPGGLVNKNMRQRVWPLLINANTTIITPKPTQEEMEAMTKTYSQVVMDVNRSSSRFPPGIDDHVRMSMKDKLVDLIMRVMLKHPQLKYYQGFHDVCITFLLCMDEDLAFAMVDKLAMGYMREYLDETMERTSLLLNFVYPLVNRCNPELCAHMNRNDLGTIFALSWVITWFSHVLGDIRRILRVFDFFLASHRMMPVYLSAAFVLYREKDMYAAGDEMGYIHKCLSTIPPDLPLESLLERAGDLYLQYPPSEISRDPMLVRMNRQIYEHFNRIDNRNASRRVAQQTNDRGRLFVKATMWTVTAVVGVAVAVLYHNYMVVPSNKTHQIEKFLSLKPSWNLCPSHPRVCGNEGTDSLVSRSPIMRILDLSKTDILKSVRVFPVTTAINESNSETDNLESRMALSGEIYLINQNKRPRLTNNTALPHLNPSTAQATASDSLTRHGQCIVDMSEN